MRGVLGDTRTSRREKFVAAVVTVRGSVGGGVLGGGAQGLQDVRNLSLPLSLFLVVVVVMVVFVVFVFFCWY